MIKKKKEKNIFMYTHKTLMKRMSFYGDEMMKLLNDGIEMAV